jgi:hypothetical protein
MPSITCMNLMREAARDKELGKKERKKTEGINGLSSLAIKTGLSQLTMVEVRKGKKGWTREDGRRRGRV